MAISCGFGRYFLSFLPQKNPKPRNLNSGLFGLIILDFSAFTISPSLSSINRTTLRMTRLADISLLTSMIQSSAYLTKRNWRDSSSLSSSLSIMLLSNGDKFPPWGVPIVDSISPSSVRIPLTKYFLISDMTSPSSIVRATRFIRRSWWTVSKNRSKSISTTHW